MKEKLGKPYLGGWMGCLKLDIQENELPTLKVVHGDGKVAQRWLSTDPLAADYPGWSPYNYVMGNPIKYIDPDGMRVVTADQAAANRIANDINVIYQQKYGTDAVAVGVVAMNTYGVNESGQRVITGTTYELVAESDFDWGTDKYTAALYDQITRDKTFLVEMKPEGEGGVAPWPMHSTPIEKWGGGYTNKGDDLIKIQSNLPEATEDNYGSELTIGGVFLHEVIGHLHNRGNMEKSMAMKTYYGLPGETGPIRNHEGGVETDDLLRDDQLSFPDFYK